MTNFEINSLITQYGLLAATLFFYGKLVLNDKKRDKRTVDADIKKWCKCVFVYGANSPGALQRAGEKVRERYPNRINLILTAYDELLVEDQQLGLPQLYKFLELMEGVESGKWPSSGSAMAGKLKFYE